MDQMPKVGDLLSFESTEGHGERCRAFVRVLTVHPPMLVRATPVLYLEGEKHLRKLLKKSTIPGRDYFLVNIGLCEPFNIIDEIGKLDKR